MADGGDVTCFTEWARVGVVCTTEEVKVGVVCSTEAVVGVAWSVVGVASSCRGEGRVARWRDGGVGVARCEKGGAVGVVTGCGVCDGTASCTEVFGGYGVASAIVK